MKTRIFIIAILSAITIVASAQTYGNSYTPAARDYSASLNQRAIQSQRIMATGNAYNGTVYEPFSTAMPSEYSEVGSRNSSEGTKPERQIRKGLIGGPEDPLGPSPIGEPWVLLLMAVAFGGVIYLSRKKQIKH